MTGNGRIVENNCARQQFDQFIQRLMSNTELSLKSHKPATDTVLQDRYTFSCEYERISIVYEINSKTLVITACDHLLRLLKTELGSLSFSRIENEPSPQILYSARENLSDPTKTQAEIRVKTNPTGQVAAQAVGQSNQKAKTVAPIENSKPKVQRLESKTAVASGVEPNVGSQAARQAGPKMGKISQKIGVVSQSEGQSKAEGNAQAENRSKTALKQKPVVESEIKVKAQDKAQAEARAKAAKKLAEEKAKAAKKLAEEKASRQAEEKAETARLLAEEETRRLEELYKDGFSIKKYPSESLDGVLKKLKTLKGVTCRQLPNADNSRSYKIADAKNKVYLRYIDTKKTLQLQGRRSNLFGEVQVLVSQESDYVTAVSSHIDLTGEEKRARDMEKRLKKLLPNAFEFLSEQSRIDLTIGMMDIGNEEVRLSDYSMLLVPPYRGLERLIFDLQRLKNIEVKMIGQAYEKTDTGEYVLKLGYRRKINSVVYAEVMSALYTEYFARRNFYAHSDITGDLLSRVITEKSAVREIFERLIETIEYNILKLKEIGLKPQP